MTTTHNTVPHNNNNDNFYSLITKSTKNGWVVTASSDGLDRYSMSSNVLNSDGYGIGGLSNPKAWYVMSKIINAKTYEFCVQTDGYLECRIKYSSGAGFTSGSFGLDQVPSSPNETVLLGSGTDASPIFQPIVSLKINVNNSILHLNVTTSTKVYNFMLNPVVPPVVSTLPVINKILT